MILSDFTCPHHGRFEALADAEAESMPCPSHVALVVPATARISYLNPDRNGVSTVYKYEGDPPAAVSCGLPSPWSPSPVRGRVRLAEVERGGVEQAASPMYLSTRELGEGMPHEEWRAKRDKMYEERRHKESKDL